MNIPTERPEPVENIADWYNHNGSVSLSRSIGPESKPIPWISYPAYSYLEQLDISDKNVFEYGCGSSTLYYAARAKSVTSVEHDEKWFIQVENTLPDNCRITQAVEREYIEHVATGGPYDLIVVDGRWRYDCIRFAVDHLAPNGMMVLDNADRYYKATEFMREQNFIQVDMIGNAPIVNYIFSTTIFLSRDFNWKPAKIFQPHMLPGMTDSYEARPDFHDESNRAGSPN